MMTQQQLNKLVQFIETAIEEHTTRTQYAIRGNIPPQDIGAQTASVKEDLFEAFGLEMPQPVDEN